MANPPISETGISSGIPFSSESVGQASTESTGHARIDGTSWNPNWIRGCYLCKVKMKNIWVFPKIVGFPPKSSIFNRVFHYFHHPFWSTPNFWKHPYASETQLTRFSPSLSLWSFTKNEARAKNATQWICFLNKKTPAVSPEVGNCYSSSSLLISFDSFFSHLFHGLSGILSLIDRPPIYKDFLHISIITKCDDFQQQILFRFLWRPTHRRAAKSTSQHHSIKTLAFLKAAEMRR